MAVSPIKREEIARRVYGIRRSIDKVAAGDSVLFLREIEPQTLFGLYRDLILPVADVLAGRAKVIADPDGPLHTVPLEFLVTRFAQADERAFRSTRSASDGSKDRPFLSEYSPLEFRQVAPVCLSAESYPTRAPLSEGPGQTQPSPSRLRIPNSTRCREFSTATRGADAPGGNAEKATGTPEIIRPRARRRGGDRENPGGESELYFGEGAGTPAKIATGARASCCSRPTGSSAGNFSCDPNAGPARHVLLRGQLVLAMTLVGDLKGEDGMLTMKEVIEDVELNADLVALSACNTAGETAQANNGEGFAGLTRAFMFAGARALLVSHWSVDSLSTQALMTAMFRNVKSGATRCNR
jgi:hypothetical protein